MWETDLTNRGVTHSQLETPASLQCGAKWTDLFWRDYCWVHTSQSILGLVLALKVGKVFHLAGDLAA